MKYFISFKKLHFLNIIKVCIYTKIPCGTIKNLKKLK